MKKRIISVFLVLSIFLASVPQEAYAEGGGAGTSFSEGGIYDVSSDTEDLTETPSNFDGSPVDFTASERENSVSGTIHDLTWSNPDSLDPADYYVEVYCVPYLKYFNSSNWNISSDELSKLDDSAWREIALPAVHCTDVDASDTGAVVNFTDVWESLDSIPVGNASAWVSRVAVSDVLDMIISMIGDNYGLGDPHSSDFSQYFAVFRYALSNGETANYIKYSRVKYYARYVSKEESYPDTPFKNNYSMNFYCNLAGFKPYGGFDGRVTWPKTEDLTFYHYDVEPGSDYKGAFIVLGASFVKTAYDRNNKLYLTYQKGRVSLEGQLFRFKCDSSLSTDSFKIGYIGNVFFLTNMTAQRTYDTDDFGKNDYYTYYGVPDPIYSDLEDAWGDKDQLTADLYDVLTVGGQELDEASALRLKKFIGIDTDIPIFFNSKGSYPGDDRIISWIQSDHFVSYVPHMEYGPFVQNDTTISHVPDTSPSSSPDPQEADVDPNDNFPVITFPPMPSDSPAETSSPDSTASPDGTGSGHCCDHKDVIKWLKTIYQGNEATFKQVSVIRKAVEKMYKRIDSGLDSIVSVLDQILDKIPVVGNIQTDNTDVVDWLKKIHTLLLMQLGLDVVDSVLDKVQSIISDKLSGIAGQVESISQTAETVFPFSIIFIPREVFALLAVKPVTPYKEIKIKTTDFDVGKLKGGGMDFSFTLDLADYDDVAKIVRVCETIIFLFALIPYTIGVIDMIKKGGAVDD